jgi:ATP-binding cassette subfamily B multidrug efflux pump
LASAKSAPLARLLSYVARVPLEYGAGALFTVAYAVGFQFVPLASGAVIERIYAGAPLAQVGAAVRHLVLVAAAVALLRLASRVAIFRGAREIEYSIRNDFFAQLQRLSQRYFAVHRTGDLMSRAVNDLNAIRLFLGLGVLNLVQTPVLLVGAAAVLLSRDALLTVLVVSPYLLLVLLVRVLAARIQPESLGVQEQLGELSTCAQENAAGVQVVRAYTLEPQQEQRFAQVNQQLYARQIRLARYQLGLQPAVSLLPAIGLVMLLFAGGARVRSGALSVGDFATFNAYLAMLTAPTLMLGWVVVLAQRGLASLARVGEVLDELPAIRDAASVGRSAPARLRGAVELRGLSYAYVPGAEPALRGVSLRVEPGETLGVVGTVGSGKTTLVSAIPRLLELEPGQLFIDGRDVCELPLELLRQGIAMVPQDSFLFSTSVAQNIAFGLPSVDLARVREAARRAQVLAEIEELPHGLETEVGERGITLSGGQRQRIALARALALEPAILILDDALSSVDAAAEEAILKELRAARAGRTCFIVAHRLSAVRDADAIAVLEAGALVEHGSHEQLLRAGGIYAELWRRQQLEAELEAPEPARAPGAAQVRA